MYSRFHPYAIECYKQRREEGLLRSGNNNECESEAIRELIKLLENNWNIKLIRDGAHNDIGIQRKNNGNGAKT